MEDSQNTIEKGFDRLVEGIFNWLPQFLGALLIVFIGHLIAKTLARLVRAGLNSLSLDKRMQDATGGNTLQRAVPSPTTLIAKITYWLIFIGAISLGATVLGIDALNRLIAAVYGFVPQALAALAIFLIGSAIAAGVTGLVNNTMGHTPTGKLLESIAPVIVMGLTIFMILDQLNVAPVIVTITYAALVGSVALASALAFGLGGRDVASRMLEATYEKGQANIDQARQDFSVGKERAVKKARQAKSRNS